MTVGLEQRTHSPGRLEAILRAGHFAVTAETTPPDAAGAEAVLDRAGCLKGFADAVNVTDGAGARAHMSALAAAAILVRAGIEPVLQFTTRDRNRLALQGDLLGAAALGVPNILCLTGDGMSAGDQPEAKPVFDLDSGALMRVARDLREDGMLPSGREVSPRPGLFIGAADLPIEPGPDWKPEALLAKAAAGADFVQTQYCFDMNRLRRYLARLAEFDLTDRLYYFVGIGPIASARSARWMNDNLWGVEIPEPIIARLEGATDQAAEGRRICIELIQELSEMAGVAGVHLMAPRGEANAARVIEDSGVLAAREAAA